MHIFQNMGKLFCVEFQSVPFYLAALKGSGVLSSPERAGGRADKPR